MSEQRPNLRYRSTGKAVITEEADEARQLREARRAQNPASARLKALDEIRQHRESLEKSPTEKHDSAVKHFDYSYRDLTRNPQLLRHVGEEYRMAVDEAAKKGEVIDWNQKLPEIGERVRKNAGMPSSVEIERTESLADMRRSRGQE